MICHDSKVISLNLGLVEVEVRSSSNSVEDTQYDQRDLCLVWTSILIFAC